MNIPQLQIQTTPAKIGLQVTKPVQEIEQPRASLSIQQPAAILDISTTRPQLSLDTTENRADLDLKSAFRRIAENAQYGHQKVQEGIGRRAQEGSQLMKIENGASIADIIKQSTERPMAQLQVKFVGDRTKIKTDVTAGSLDIQVKPQKPIIDAQINKPIHNYTPGKVDVVMEQYGSIDIDWKV
ncbi:hypothetical protein DV702_01060 [Sporosarcina sp. PTS2304]|uniref:DUF6470 family protein n=1 Tax=Sporosarcina sp. PTS2304 TaxID=2283194 RepID=UPI000E0E08F7|nr:DUF6470 family protein [Sporosarcina sp. PTS2304]AXH98417.1 hypothetical protein DV702_01060 [Sporosarcina sp. PTS2304]